MRARGRHEREIGRRGAEQLRDLVHPPPVLSGECSAGAQGLPDELERGGTGLGIGREHGWNCAQRGILVDQQYVELLAHQRFELREGSFTVPALRDGRLLGLLMRYDARSQTADVIPAPVISHFLEDAKLESYPGFPRAGLNFTSTRDPQFRRYIGLNEDGGVYVTEVRPGSAAEKAGLRKGDIILAVADKPVDQDGNYDEPVLGKIPFSHLTNTLAHVGDIVNFKILRGGKDETVPVKVAVATR